MEMVMRLGKEVCCLQHSEMQVQADKGWADTDTCRCENRYHRHRMRTHQMQRILRLHQVHTWLHRHEEASALVCLVCWLTPQRWTIPRTRMMTKKRCHQADVASHSSTHLNLLLLVLTWPREEGWHLAVFGEVHCREEHHHHDCYDHLACCPEGWFESRGATTGSPQPPALRLASP